jgi:hypothetical protein
MTEKTTDVSPFAQALAESVGARQAFKVCIVAACHIQPSKQWVQALNVAARTATIIIVDDSNGKVQYPDNWDVYDYDRQREVLGEDLYKQFEMFHKSSACKTFGIWLAYERGFDPIIVIDSDCIIPPDFVAKHIEALLQSGDGWDNPLKGSGFYSRGFPYYERNKPVWAHMGLWENELDLYGTDRVGVQFVPKMPPKLGRMSTGAFFPLSGMNVSFRNDAAPYMMFLPNFMNGEEKFTRHDDIWGGYIFQMVARARGFALSYGDPLVFHDTVVIPEEDAKEEEAMIKYERKFYRFVEDALNMTLWWGQEIPTPSEVWGDLADYVKRNPSIEFEGLEPAFRFAADMFRPKV